MTRTIEHSIGRIKGLPPLVFILALFVAFPRESAAQSTSSDKGPLVTVVLASDSVTHGKSVRVVRSHRMNYLYLRRSTATSGILENAMRALVIAQLEFKTNPGRSSVAELEFQRDQSSDPATVALFTKLSNAQAREVGEAGMAPAVLVRLPGKSELKAIYRGHYQDTPTTTAPN
jgi:hypothetical protein